MQSQKTCISRWLASAVLVSSLSATSVAETMPQLSCLLQPSEHINLSSSATGIVREVHVERGQEVKKDEVLVSLNDSVERASLATHHAKMDFAKRKLDRNQSVFDENMLSDFALDELRTEYELAKLIAGEAQERLNLRKITSPIDGIVIQRHVSAGEYIGEQPALALAAIDPLYAEVVLRADKYGSIDEGMQVAIEIANGEKTRVPGEVKIVDKLIDGASGTFGIRIEIPNPENTIPSGLKCQVLFNNSLANHEAPSKSPSQPRVTR